MRHRHPLLFLALLLGMSSARFHAFLIRPYSAPFKDGIQSTARYSVGSSLDLSDNFSRWRFLQNLLDAELEASDVNEVIYSVLDSYLRYQDSNRDDGNEQSLPRLTPEIRNVIESLLSHSESSQKIPALSDPECSPGSEMVLAQLEKLLPDPTEDEDAFKGTWDTVIQLHGRESVKMNESGGDPQWRAVCLVSRFLIYFDFLSRGVTFQSAP